MVKNPPANAGDVRDAGSIPELGRSLGKRNGNQLQYSCLENPMDRGMATNSSILAWRIPWTEEPEKLQSIGLQRVGDNNKKISPVKSIQDIIISLD